MGRSDGSLIKDLPPIQRFVPYIMEDTVDAQNHCKQYIDFQPLREFAHDAKRRGLSVSYMSILIAAYLRSLNSYPQVNRFVMNKRIYQRKGFTVSLVVLKDDGDAYDETVIKVPLELDDDVFEVTRKISEAIELNRKSAHDNNMDNFMNTLLKMPALLGAAVKFLKFLDRHGKLPKKVIELSPFHTGLFITNLASIRTSSIYHHIYEFGTTCVFISMGEFEKQLYIKEGEVASKTVLPLGVVLDERICTGIEFSRFFKQMMRYLKNPSLLEGPPTPNEAVNEEALSALTV